MVAADITPSLAPAYFACLRIARAHTENFPVASWLLPAALRPHVAAIYAFARIADDFADEPGRSPTDRLALLGDWQQRLVTSIASRSRLPSHLRDLAYAPDLMDVRHLTELAELVFAALASTRVQFALPLEPFADLLSAFRQDITVDRYRTWDELLDYCRRSANPVGRLVLRLCGYNQPEIDCHSDAVCTALQLTNFWQDFAIDWNRGRLYLPSEISKAVNASDADLGTARLSPQWRLAVREAVARTRRLFAEGRPVCNLVDGRLRYELRATCLGGVRILDRLERHEFDMVGDRPRLTATDAIVIGWKTLTWPATPRSTTRS